MLNKGCLALLLGLALFGSYEYLSAPVFWQRFLSMFGDGDKPAYSRVFSPSEQVTSDRIIDLPVANGSDKTLSAQSLPDVVEYAKQYDSHGLLVIHNGKVQLEWYAEGFDADTLTQSQSMHKTLQALLLGIAIEDGMIESEQVLMSRYLDEWVDDTRSAITIEQALRMTTGLKNIEQSLNPWGEGFRWLFAADTVTATLRFPQQRRAGEVFDYNDINAQALGIVLSRATGMRYADYLRQKLWNPIGGQPAKVWLDHEGGEAMHACCLLATVRDWGRIGLMLQQGGEINGQRIVSSQWIERMTTPSAVTPHYGYQVWLANNSIANTRATGYQRTEQWLADDVYFLSGYGAQRVYVSRQKQLVVVRLGPASGYLPKITNDWDNVYLFNRLVRGIKP